MLEHGRFWLDGDVRSCSKLPFEKLVHIRCGRWALGLVSATRLPLRMAKLPALSPKRRGPGCGSRCRRWRSRPRTLRIAGDGVMEH